MNLSISIKAEILKNKNDGYILSYPSTSFEPITSGIDNHKGYHRVQQGSYSNDIT